MIILWQFQDAAMIIPWLFNTHAFHNNYMILPILSYMIIPGLFHDYSMISPWVFDCNSMLVKI
jgi:hypothetical protein